MNSVWPARRGVVLWQLLFILLSTSWLLAPYLNHLLSYRTSLISQYEAPGQPYAWLFRLGDILGAALLIWVAGLARRRENGRLAAYLLLVIGGGMLVDALWPVSCSSHLTICQENFSVSFVVHAAETVITASAIFALSAYDGWRRRRLASVGFVIFQLLYAALFLSQLADQEHFNTLSQYVYQLLTIVWIAWFYRDYFLGANRLNPSSARGRLIKLAVAGWAFVNGLLAIVLSLTHLHLLGRIMGLYFAGNHAWLAQHGVIAGVILLYLSRHLARGELRARQIFLFLAGLEVLEYSVLAPNLPLLVLYLLTFCGLFVLRDEFDRGVAVVTFEVRLKDALFMLTALLLATLLALELLLRTNRLSRITSQSIDHFFDYTVSSRVFPHGQLRSALLAHTISAFLVAGIAAILWILFRPYKKQPAADHDYQQVVNLLARHSGSSEDYFKLWPADKDYFWAPNKDGFIAYKAVGPVAFALADPICTPSAKADLIKDFITWARAQRLRVCFLPVYQPSLASYEAAGLNSQQIGAYAMVNIGDFLNETIKDKWWRWQQNRAAKQGYEHFFSQPPHSQAFMAELKKVSDAWLGTDRQERTFALGYFDENYVQQCSIDYLKDKDGRVVAFANRLPSFKQLKTTSVDMIRYLPDANNAMPFLLLKTIERVAENKGYKYFDLGFVPFAAAKGPVIAVARNFSRFSARGLEQFKNKFKPDWQPNYLAYDGDLADFALVAVNVEKAMRPE